MSDQTHVGPRNHVLDGVQIATGTGTFERIHALRCNVHSNEYIVHYLPIQHPRRASTLAAARGDRYTAAMRPLDELVWVLVNVGWPIMPGSARYYNLLCYISCDLSREWRNSLQGGPISVATDS